VSVENRGAVYAIDPSVGLIDRFSNTRQYTALAGRCP